MYSLKAVGLRVRGVRIGWEWGGGGGWVGGWLEGPEVPLMRIVLVSINREIQILVLAVIWIKTRHNTKKTPKNMTFHSY